LDAGKLAFLMPKMIAFQQSYDGFRQFRSGSVRRRFLEFHDWSEAGHPFSPVQEKFMTYVIGSEKELTNFVIPVTAYIKRRGAKLAGDLHIPFDEAMMRLDKRKIYAAQVMPHNTAYTIADTVADLLEFKEIAGESYYIGREGIEFFPQELLLFKKAETPPASPSEGCVFVSNIQVEGSKYKVPEDTIELETKYLFPLVKGVDISKFGLDDSGIVVPFPYRQTLNALLTASV